MNTPVNLSCVKIKEDSEAVMKYEEEEEATLEILVNPDNLVTHELSDEETSDVEDGSAETANGPMQTEKELKYGAKTCETCGKSISVTYLKAHRRLHRKTRAFVCSICEQNFSSNAYLKRHILTHSGSLQFFCTHCGKGFYQKTECDKHEIIHMDNKPFSCQYCDKTFAQKGNLKAHEVLHISSKPFCCDSCDKQFSTKYYLIRHAKIHISKEFSCMECGKDFTTQTKLNNHVHDTKPFVCDVCNKGFILERNLETHKITHRYID